MDKVHIAVIGAGVVGLAVVCELSKSHMGIESPGHTASLSIAKMVSVFLN